MRFVTFTGLRHLSAQQSEKRSSLHVVNASNVFSTFVSHSTGRCSLLACRCKIFRPSCSPAICVRYDGRASLQSLPCQTRPATLVTDGPYVSQASSAIRFDSVIASTSRANRIRPPGARRKSRVLTALHNLRTPIVLLCAGTIALNQNTRRIAQNALTRPASKALFNLSYLPIFATIAPNKGRSPSITPENLRIDNWGGEGQMALRKDPPRPGHAA